MQKRHTTARVGVVLLAAGALWLYATRTHTERRLDSAASAPGPAVDTAANIRRDAGRLSMSMATEEQVGFSEPPGSGLNAQYGIDVVVLAHNRPASLSRLLDSLSAAHYRSRPPTVEIMIDGADAAVHRVARKWRWQSKEIVTRTVSAGLREAWLGALSGKSKSGYWIIFEDDLTVSPKWHSWLSSAWAAYGGRADLAGISLQRQTLIPQNPSKHAEIVNAHMPYLYKLVGSIGFSPHPTRWQEFLAWVGTKNLTTFDARVEGLVTSDWYNKLNKKSMWTQLFIRFCEERGLYTLYVNLPDHKALAAHWRERGEHFGGGQGRDFEVAVDVEEAFPGELVKYGWDARKEAPVSTAPHSASARKGRPTSQQKYATELHADTTPVPKRHTVVVLGTAQNIAAHANGCAETIRNLQDYFDVLGVIVYENDSVDRTLARLREWSFLLGTRVNVISESKVRGTRTQRLAHARNLLWRKARLLQPAPTYVMMMDMDGVNHNLKGVQTCTGLPEGWGACCANQRTAYYDLWALRTFDKWVDCDVWYECTADRTLRFRHIPANHSPIAVKSCFGGAALYDLARVHSDSLYVGTKNGHEQCEHVSFHEQLGSPMYIQPRMLNDAPAQHLPAKLGHVIE
jgi:hypothetical protein